MAPLQQDVCVACHEALLLEIEANEDDEHGNLSSSSMATTQQVDDDVLLQCGCHFHWQCLLDAYSLTGCPNCRRNLLSTSSTGSEQILCTLKNEGGTQEGTDILPMLTEESYLRAYPEERKYRAFLEFCANGDIPAILETLQSHADEAEEEEEDNDDDEEDDEEELGDSQATLRDQAKMLRYQDQLGSFNSGLHLAVEHDRVEVAWLLLFLASNLDASGFPATVLSVAGDFGLVRNEQGENVDIRSLKDSDGMTAEQKAANRRGVWEELVQRGTLRVP